MIILFVGVIEGKIGYRNRKRGINNAEIDNIALLQTQTSGNFFHLSDLPMN